MTRYVTFTVPHTYPCFQNSLGIFAARIAPYSLFQTPPQNGEILPSYQTPLLDVESHFLKII